MTFLPKLQKRSERSRWHLINDSSFSFSTSNFRARQSRPRSSQPPGLPNVVPSSPPPTYNQALSLPAGLANGRPRHSRSATPVSPVSPIQERATPRLTSDNLSRLDDVSRSDRYGRVNNRISNISQYPVFLDSPQRSSRWRASRRRLSIASTSTTGVYLAMGQLPGSEPFESPSQEVLTWQDGRPSQPQSPRRDMEDATIYETAQAVRVQAVRSSPAVSTTSVNRINRISIVSTGSTLELNPQRARSSSHGVYGSPVSSLRPARTWPVLPRDSTQLASSLSDGDVDRPPPPPPKDPGYVCRPRPSGLRQCSSTPNLLLSGAQGPTPTFDRFEARPRTERGGTGKGQHHRSWLGSIGGNRYHRHKSQSANISPVAETAPNGHVKGNHHQSTSNRRSQLLVACARLIGRAMPRVTVHSKGA